jgi:hypothetical protein
VVAGGKDSDHQVDDREQAGTASPVHPSVSVGGDFARPLFVAAGALLSDLGLLAKLVGLLPVILGHGAVPLGLGLSPAHLALSGDPAPLRRKADQEQQDNDGHHCDHDDCDR